MKRINTEIQNSKLYRFSKALGAKTGTPVLINTFLNLRSEHIVCSPEDAVSCFKKSEVNNPTLGDYWITKKIQ